MFRRTPTSLHPLHPRPAHNLLLSPGEVSPHPSTGFFSTDNQVHPARTAYTGMNALHADFHSYRRVGMTECGGAAIVSSRGDGGGENRQ